jgi:hypothetical protein
MVLRLLGIIDLIAGISLAIPNPLSFFLGIAELIKGGSSFLGGIGEIGFLVLGVIDIIGGIVLLLGIYVPFLWLIFILKGVFTAIFSVGN